MTEILSDDKDTEEVWNHPEHLEMREVLMKNGADLGIRDNRGSTPLELAKGETFGELV